MKKLKLVSAFLLCFGYGFAQDPQFTQFYAAPLYHNPAFTGGGYAPRVIFNYRNQWPSLNANFITSAVSVDHYIDKLNSGIGVTFLNDSQGSNRLKNTEINILYAYQLKLDETNFLRMGLQGGYSLRGFDGSGLTFGDQYTDQGYQGGTSIDPFLNKYATSFQFFDYSAGALFYNPKIFLGVSMHHISKPGLTFSDPATTTPSVDCKDGDCVPRKIMVNGGLNIPLRNPFSGAGNYDREFVATPAFLFKQQGKFSQLDLGAYVTYTPLTLGLWYRGIPLKKVGTTRNNHDAIAALVGFRFENFSVGYSYDVTISSLGVSSGGSHEISLSYQLEKFESEKNPYKRRKKKELACPKF
jgi:type IX secretion system PorP/SprF family membrane protein